VGFGTEVLFMMALGLVVLGPKRLHAMLGHVARAKAEFEHAARGMKSQLAAELAVTSLDEKSDASPELALESSEVSLAKLKLAQTS
jgi:Sec-independent protein translocase protein TatA